MSRLRTKLARIAAELLTVQAVGCPGPGKVLAVYDEGDPAAPPEDGPPCPECGDWHHRILVFEIVEPPGP